MKGAVVEAGRVPENDASCAVDPGVADRVHESVQVVEAVSASRLVAISPVRLLGESVFSTKVIPAYISGGP